MTGVQTCALPISGIKKESFIENSNVIHIDLRNDYIEKVKVINNIIENSNNWIEEAIQALNVKFDNPHVTVKAPQKPPDYEAEYASAIRDMNELIAEHNSKVDNHDQEVMTAREQLENHLIAVALEEQDYKAIKKEFEELLSDTFKKQNLVILKDLEFLFAFGVDLAPLRLHASNGRHLVLLLPGEKSGNKTILYHETEECFHRPLPSNLVMENHTWEISHAQ